MNWRNRCPKNKYGRHTFKTDTHQCECGRWERGYAPKKEPVKPRDECQICEGTFACHNGVLGHHGYKRPGWGFIVGDCTGVDHKPFPATDALVKYRESLDRYIEGRKNAMKRIKKAETLDYEYKDGPSWDKSTKTITVPIAKGFKGGFIEGHKHRFFPTFEELKGYEIKSVERELDHAANEAKRIDARIEKALALTATPA